MHPRASIPVLSSFSRHGKTGEKAYKEFVLLYVSVSEIHCRDRLYMFELMCAIVCQSSTPVRVCMCVYVGVCVCTGASLD